MERFSQQVLLTGKLKVKQHYRYDCGAACLSSVAAYYGVSTSLAHIRILSGCTPDGISIQGLIDAAGELGFEARGYRSSNKDLSVSNTLHLPAIAHLKEKDSSMHYVVVYDIAPTCVKIMDPAEGAFKKIPLQEFSCRWSGYIVKIYPQGGISSYNNLKGYRSYLASLMKGGMKELIQAFAGTLVCICTGMATTLLLQQIIDVIVPAGNREILVLACPALFLLMLFSLYMGYRATGHIIRCSIKMEYSIMSAYIGKLFKLPEAFFSNYTAGDISSRSDDIHLVRSFITGGITSMAASCITLFAALGIMLCYNSRMACWVLCFLPAYWLLYKAAGKISGRWSRQVATANAAFEGDMLENIAAMQCIRHYNGSDDATFRLEESYISLSHAVQGAAWASNKYQTAVQGVSRILVCMVLTAGTAAVFNNGMTLGELVGFYSLCSFFTMPMDDLITSIMTMTKASVAARRIYEVLSIKTDSQKGKALSPKGLDGDIAIRSLHFKYPGREPVFNGTDMVIQKGKITRIAGESGLGKSTLLKLIAADYTPTAGTITFAGTDISLFDLAQWRTMLGYVDQRPSILNLPILENITVGDPNPDIARVMQICKELGMEEMVSRFPQGLLTRAGRGGYALSGGECQKIGLARALYKDPQIFLLDEATSSLDIKSEEKVAQCIHRLRDMGKTIIFVSHRKESCIVADNVVKIDRAGSKW
ncbi:MAG: peptidase domain-containing ABC transporter [Bacteroidales bacterium]|nr:peptidase domain-containing ABC transporter [Bacteroidales bacterium]